MTYQKEKKRETPNHGTEKEKKKLIPNFFIVDDGPEIVGRNYTQETQRKLQTKAQSQM